MIFTAFDIGVVSHHKRAVVIIAVLRSISRGLLLRGGSNISSSGRRGISRFAATFIFSFLKAGLTLTVLTFPFLSGLISVTRPRGQTPGAVTSSRIITMSSTFRGVVIFLHLFLARRVVR